MRKRLTGVTITYVSCLMFFFIVQMVTNKSYDDYWYDLVEYASFGRSIFQEGDFSFLHMQTDFRGWLFPFLFGLAQEVFHSIIFLRIVLSMLYAMAVVLVGYTWDEIIHEENEMAIRPYIITYGLVLIIVIFFRGLIIYPFSDLPAAACCVIGACCIYYACHTTNSIWKMVLYTCAGGFSYAAYNIRTIYIFSLLICFGYGLLCEIRQKKDYLKRVLMSAGYVLGVLVVAFPQVFINYKWYHKWSILINNRNLYVNQLIWGLQYTRFEGYIGTKNIEKTTAALRFVSSLGTDILNKITLNSSGEATVWGYLLLAIRFPIAFIQVLIEHIVTICTPLFPEIFITDLYVNRTMLVFASTLVVASCLWALRFEVERRNMKLQVLCWLLIMIPSATTITMGAIETRFGVLLYVIFGLVMLGAWTSRDFVSWIKRESPWRITTEYLALTLVFLIVNNTVLHSLSGLPLSLHKGLIG